jgi:hypothetical protein
MKVQTDLKAGFLSLCLDINVRLRLGGGGCGDCKRYDPCDRHDDNKC